MSIKDILLHLDDSPACENRTDVALNLARRQGARVTGLFVEAFDYYQPHYLHSEEKMAAVRQLLRVKAEDLGVETSFRTVESNVSGVGTCELLTRSSHFSDLVIVGQESRRTARASAIVEHLVAGCGRPVLIIPATGTFQTVGTRVLVAWKNGREATRTIHDALPILQRADQVTLLAVASEEESGRNQWQNILNHLNRHGIEARTEIMPATSAPLADSLLNHACEGGYDLLLMGAIYPGSRSSQLGRGAAQILREMTVPVLMSH
ncbi:MAG: universal stress protein [Desulfuromonadaceae bacterium]|nr:universal stress protein [Desulfuromonadaceae bacterium]MDD5107767.1 universal stress protein [Desulfuromonadaceae bacterium]